MFVLLLPKGVYRYEYLNNQEKVKETRDFYGDLNAKGTTDAD